MNKSIRARGKRIRITEILNILCKTYTKDSHVYRDAKSALHKLGQADIETLWLLVITSK